MPHKILFYVQHLLGIGHVVRAARISRALVRSGFRVQIAFGGRPLAGIDWGGAELTHLPAVEAAPGGFSNLVTADGAEIDEAFKQARTAQLLSLLNEAAPDVLLIEAYPFARRIMRFELKPLIAETRSQHPNCLIVSSIRDILQEGRKPERIQETAAIIETSFDYVLVHGDPELARLELTFPAAHQISRKVHYTGIVSPEQASAPEEVFDVIVSAGGGAVGSSLFEAALAARPNCILKDHRWLVVTGPNLNPDEQRRIQAFQDQNLAFAAFRPDLPALLQAAKLSISQAGYNTMADVLRAGCRSVVVPFARGGETEQTRRANLLQDRGLTAAISENDLSPERLARTIDAAMASEPGSLTPQMNGAEATAKLLSELINSHQS